MPPPSIGVAAVTFSALLIPLVQNGEQLIVVRLLTGLGGGFAVSASFPIAAELLAGNTNAFRLIALPGGLAFFVAPALIPFPDPGKPALAFAKGSGTAGGRHRQPDHPLGILRGRMRPW